MAGTQEHERKDAAASIVVDHERLPAGSQHLHRKLRGKEVHLFAVGGAIGTCISQNIMVKLLETDDSSAFCSDGCRSASGRTSRTPSRFYSVRDHHSMCQPMLRY